MKSRNNILNRSRVWGLLVLSGLWTACAHDHSHDHATDAHDHSHDHDHAEEEARAALWGWSESLEVFVDLAAPRVGEAGSWAVHLTDPAGGIPLTDVAVMIELQGPGGNQELLRNEFVKPGLYKTTWIPESVGEWSAAALWDSGAESGRLPIGALDVVGTDEEPVAQAGGGDVVGVTKEQVWSVPFTVEKVQTDTFRMALHAAGKWLAAPGDEFTQHASASGVIRYGSRQLVPGVKVQAGELLFVLTSGNMTGPGMEAARVEAFAEFEAADAARNRVEALREAGAATLAEWEEASRRWQIASEARDRWADVVSDRGIEVRSEQSGVIRDVLVTQGAFVNPGDALVRMAAAENALLEVQVSPDWAPAVERWQSVDVELAGEWTPCEVVSINRTVTQGAGMLPVFVGCPTAGNQPIPGTFADVVMRHGEGRQALVIPESALLERYGTYEVAVQTGGEQFTLRPIQLGERGAGEVEVLSGLDAGDLVVTDGAYTVRMISMKGSTPAHGHTH